MLKLGNGSAQDDLHRAKEFLDVGAWTDLAIELLELFEREVDRFDFVILRRE
jgi:hypothetical protein